MARGGDGTPSRPAPKKEKMKRPEGMSREAFALLGDSHPIAPVVELSKKAELKGLKEKRKISSPKGTVSRQDQVNGVHTKEKGAGGEARLFMLHGMLHLVLGSEGCHTDDGGRDHLHSRVVWQD